MVSLNRVSTMLKRRWKYKKNHDDKDHVATSDLRTGQLGVKDITSSTCGASKNYAFKEYNETNPELKYSPQLRGTYGIDSYLHNRYSNDPDVYISAQVNDIKVGESTNKFTIDGNLVSIIMQYCDTNSLLNLQLASKAFRHHAGKRLWRTVVIKGCDRFFRRPNLGVDIGYDRHYPLPRSQDLEPPTRTIDWQHLFEFSDYLSKSGIGLWINTLMICIAYKSPGPLALTTNGNLYTNQNTDGDVVDMELAHIVTTLVPKYLKNLRSIIIFPGFWTSILPGYSIAANNGKRYSWDSIINNLFHYFPSATKQLHLEVHWISYLNQLVLTKVKTLRLAISDRQRSDFLSIPLPYFVERCDMTYMKVVDYLDGEALKTFLAPCRRLRVLNIESTPLLYNTENTDWIPPGVIEFGRQYMETNTSADYYIKHQKIEYLHIHFSQYMRSPAAVMYYKHLINLVRLHIIGPTYLDHDHERLYTSCPSLKQLHVENMPADYVMTMCSKFPTLESLLVERICCNDEISYDGRPSGLSQSVMQYYECLSRIPRMDIPNLKFLYVEISPSVQVQDATEWILKKYFESENAIQVYSGNQILSHDVRRYQYIDSPWSLVQSREFYDGFMTIRNPTLHKLELAREGTEPAMHRYEGVNDSMFVYNQSI